MPGLDLPTEDDLDPETDDFYHSFQTKERTYTHFDLPLTPEQRSRGYDLDREEQTHRFLPLLGFTDIRRKVVWDDGAYKVIEKPRPIRFASHRDAAYLQAYAEHLGRAYEKAIATDGTSGSVLAYRKGGMTNIHHAHSLFQEIRQRGDCLVVAMDISGFFDCLDHQHLRTALKDVRKTEKLSGHDLTVCRALTRYSWVETEDIDRVLGPKRRRNGMICTPNDFAKHVRGRSNGLVRTHDLQCGIPQGTPVSGLYANLYMRHFDREMCELVGELRGSYRRYSDDIAIVIPGGVKARHLVALVEKYLADYALTLSADKTESAVFSGGKLVSATPIQYLGFTFDGDQILIRDSSLDAYRRKMRRGIHAKLVAAKMKGVPSNKVFKREALSRYTHLGKRRNFLRYVNRHARLTPVLG